MRYFLAVVAKFQFFKREGSDLEWSESDILSEYFIENAVFFSQIYDIMPVPFIIHEFAIGHVSAQIFLLYFFKSNRPGIVCSQKRGGLACKKTDCC
jgi:hypothetical protein